jgi:hypothetical protein
MTARMNWKAPADRRRLHKQGAETVNGLVIGPAPSSVAPAVEVTTRRRIPQIAEPIIIDRWWKNRAHDAVYVRLAPFKEHMLIDVRVWVTPADGITRPGKGFSCTIKHLPRLVKSLCKALDKARELGMIDDEAEL